jgi:predicted enzyme related to lactoylglutathione lyase
MAKAVGIGGIFFRAENPKALAAWYAEHLGIPSGEGGSLSFDGPEAAGMTLFVPFPGDTKYFGPSSEIAAAPERKAPQQFMLDFRVDDLDQLLAKLSAAGVAIDPKREEADYGRFAWIWDPEGNRIELWQPLG